MKESIMELGLSEKEANLYLLLLKTGTCTPNKLSILSGNPRTSTYDLLKKLENKNFVNPIKKNNKTHYIAQTPDTILKNLMTKQEQISQYFEQKRKKFSSIIPKLKKLQRPEPPKQTAKVITGDSPVLNHIKTLLNSQNTTHILGDISKIIPKHHRNSIYTILNNKKLQITINTPNKIKDINNKSIKYILSTKLKKSPELIVISENITFHISNTSELQGILIESQAHKKACLLNT